MSQDFFKEMAKKTQHTPTRALDQHILGHAARVLSPKSHPWKKWVVVTGSSVAAALMIWMQVENTKFPTAMLAESPEMLKHLDEVELWAESADWTEAEWRYLETGES